MLAEKQRLEEQLLSIQSQIQNLPDGKIFCTRNGTRYKWYQSNGHTQTYIPKKERKLAQQLAIKKYLSFLYEDTLQEKKAIDLYLQHHPHEPGLAQHMLLNMPQYQELISPFFKPTSQEILEWTNTPYKGNPKYPEQLSHKTSSGHMVRSKSEALIDMVLYTNKIPFRYECALQLGDITIYPDFTICHPNTGEIFYWEHFGKMDDPSYCKNTCSKLQLYTSHGIIPTIHLITTYETQKNPLNAVTIENLVKEYFL